MQITAAINVSYLFLYDLYTYDIRLFFHQCFSASLAMIGIFYGIGNWLWLSNNLWSRLFTRIHVRNSLKLILFNNLFIVT